MASAPDLGLMVKFETLQEDGAYTAAVYMLKITPDAQYPLTPVQEARKQRLPGGDSASHS